MKELTKHEEQVLLSILKLKDNAYLVTIRDFIRRTAGKSLSFGTLFVSLRRLEEAGCLESIVGEASGRRGGKAIKYYRLTPHGLEALTDSYQTNEAMWNDFSTLRETAEESHD